MSPGTAPSEKRREEDEVTPMVATDVGVGTAAPDILGVGHGDRRNGDGVIR